MSKRRWVTSRRLVTSGAIRWILYGTGVLLLMLWFVLQQGRPACVPCGLFIVGVPAILIWRAARSADTAEFSLRRKLTFDSRCKNCGYPLHHLPSPRCPECGTAFLERMDPRDAAHVVPPPRDRQQGGERGSAGGSDPLGW